MHGVMAGAMGVLLTFFLVVGGGFQEKAIASPGTPQDAGVGAPSAPVGGNAETVVLAKSPTGQRKEGAMAEGERRWWLTSFLSGIEESFHNNIINENRYLLILEGFCTTVYISVLATVVGTVLGALLCFMRMSEKRLLNLSARIYISIMRGTPVLVLMMLIFYVVFASVDIRPTLVAVLTFGLNFAAYVAEIFRTGIAGVDRGQTEAGIGMGFTRVDTFRYIVLPQALRRILPVYKGEFITLVKMTSVVGYIAVQDLTKAGDIIRSRTFDAFFPLVMVAILYFLISWTLLNALDYLERRTSPQFRRKKAANA